VRKGYHLILTHTTSSFDLRAERFTVAVFFLPIHTMSSHSNDHSKSFGSTTSSPTLQPTFLSTNSDADLTAAAGSLHSEYVCVYNGLNGTLYAGDKALYFVGTFFFFDKKVTLPWEEVRQVQMISQGVQILCKDESVTQFTGMHHPDRVWTILVSLHNDALLDLPLQQHQSVTPRYGGVKRRSSDPMLMSNSDLEAFFEDDNVDEDNDAKRVEEFSKLREKVAFAVDCKTNLQKQTIKRSTTTPPALPSTKVSQSAEQSEVEYAIGQIRLQPIHCTYTKIKGRLYAGNGGLLFYGRRFFFDTQIVTIKFPSIQQVQIIESLSDQSDRQSSGVTILTKEGVRHKFDGMDNADKVWASLVTLHNENLTTQTPGRQRRASQLRRTNSDPALTSGPTFDIDSIDGYQNKYLKPSTAHTDPPLVTGEPMGIETTAKEDWSDVSKQADYKNVVVKDHVLTNCSLGKFYDLFLAEGAPYSMAKFLEARGDTELMVSDWKSAKDSQKWRTRVINYSHPVNAPLAPPKAGARKEQRFRRFDEFGMIVQTKTFVDDVPMADCFYVTDRIRVQPAGTDAVSVFLEFEITFVKSTMFKSIISKTTASEFTNSFRELAKFMSGALGETATVEIEKPSAPIVSEASQACTSTQPLFLVPILLAIVLLGQLWIIWEIRGIKETVRTVQCSIPLDYAIDSTT
jgi:hypothetical protein